MAIKPLIHRILVKTDVLEEVDKDYKRAKAAGILVEFATEREREQAAIDTGTVIAFGDTVFKDFGSENPVKVGDKVVYARYGGKTVKDPATEEKFVLLNDEDILAIITTEGA